MTSQAVPRGRRSDRTVAKRTPRHRPRVRPLMVFTLAVIAAFFAMTYSRISLDRTAFELQRLEAEIADQEALHFDLRVEIARLQDPTRITSMAEEMGLVYPDERVPLEVTGIAGAEGDAEYRWADLRALLSDQP